MTRQEAIEQLKKFTKDSINLYERFYPCGFGEGSHNHQMLDETIKSFEEPITLADLLGWKEGQEYEWREDIFRLQSDILQVYDKEYKTWFDSSEELNDYLRLRQAKKIEKRKKKKTVADILSWKDGDVYKWGNMKYKLENGVLCVSSSGKDWNISKYNDLNNNGKMARVIKKEAVKKEPKPKAWRVRDEYSYKCLIKELEEQGYTEALHSRGYSPVFPIIWINSNGEYKEAQLGSKRAEMCDIVDYHKERPHIKNNIYWGW